MQLYRLLLLLTGQSQQPALVNYSSIWGLSGACIYFNKQFIKSPDDVVFLKAHSSKSNPRVFLKKGAEDRVVIKCCSVFCTTKPC